MVTIRETSAGDIDDIASIVGRAFASEAEVDLVRDLLRDASAAPLLSLIALREKTPVGHILFTSARLENESNETCGILAPLSVVPEAQGRGVGSRLVGHGLEILGKSGMDLVFVLGYPAYYRRFGFRAAAARGLDAPYAIPAKHADAWMVRKLSPGIFGETRSRIHCAKAMDKPEYWTE